LIIALLAARCNFLNGSIFVIVVVIVGNLFIILFSLFALMVVSIESAYNGSSIVIVVNSLEMMFYPDGDFLGRGLWLGSDAGAALRKISKGVLCPILLYDGALELTPTLMLRATLRALPKRLDLREVAMIRMERGRQVSAVG